MVHGMFVEASHFVETVELYNREVAGRPRHMSMQSTRYAN